MANVCARVYVGPYVRVCVRVFVRAIHKYTPTFITSKDIYIGLGFYKSHLVCHKLNMVNLLVLSR